MHHWPPKQGAAADASECERLQGFPDRWTDIPGASDTARYKALGNSVAVPCVETVLAAVQNYLRWEEKD